MKITKLHTGMSVASYTTYRKNLVKKFHKAFSKTYIFKSTNIGLCPDFWMYWVYQGYDVLQKTSTLNLKNGESKKLYSFTVMPKKKG